MNFVDLLIATLSRSEIDPQDWELRKPYDPRYPNATTTRSPIRTSPSAHPGAPRGLGSAVSSARRVLGRRDKARRHDSHHHSLDDEHHLPDVRRHPHDDYAFCQRFVGFDHDKTRDDAHQPEYDAHQPEYDGPDHGAGHDDDGVYHLTVWSSDLPLEAP